MIGHGDYDCALFKPCDGCTVSLRKAFFGNFNCLVALVEIELQCVNSIGTFKAGQHQSCGVPDKCFCMTKG